MADPTGSMDIFATLGDWAFRALTGLLAILGWDIMNRTKKLEENKQNVHDALRERTELKADIATLSMRMDTQHRELRDRLDTIMDRMSAR